MSKFTAADVIRKINYEGLEGIEWFQAEDAFDPEGEDDLYRAVQDAREAWAQLNEAINTIEEIADRREEDSE